MIRAEFDLPERYLFEGHLALLAAYAPAHPQLTPPDVQGCDLSVRAVASCYGPTDLRAVYERTNQKRIIGLPKVEIGLPGVHPHEVPAVYDLASPVAHIPGSD